MGTLNIESFRYRLELMMLEGTLTREFPNYLREGMPRSAAKCALFWLLQLPVRALIWLALRPRLEKPGPLDQDEVDRVYTRQAHRYNRTHHITTRGQDTTWRRWMGWQVAANVCALKRPASVLDICCGTGLTVAEILAVTRQLDMHPHIVGLDYNEAMLGVATERRLDGDVTFCRGDATDLVSRPTSTADDHRRFLPVSFDVVTQMFGIGGIGDPVSVFRGVLDLLQEDGVYCLVDMHQPINALPGEWPICGWVKTPGLEAYTYRTTTLPLALARLWAWRDTTLDFYLAPLVTCERDGELWGFEVVSRVVESERWWFGIPVMPTCKMVLRKVRLDERTRAYRRRLLGSIID